MSAAKLSLNTLKGQDRNTAKKPHDGSVEAQSTTTSQPTSRLQGGGDKCSTGAKTTIRLSNNRNMKCPLSTSLWKSTEAHQ